MVLVTNLIALELLWVGCMALYLSSVHQKTSVGTLSKRLSGSVFFLCTAFAAYLISLQHNVWATTFSISVFLMLNCIAVTLLAAHINRPSVLFSIGALFSLILAIMGALYVG
jgi:hypothetical protein